MKNTQDVRIGVMAANAGDGTEHLFLGRAILAGFATAITDVRSLGYDAVIDIEGKLLRVQVKGFDGNQISRKSRDRGGQGIDSRDPSNRGRLVTSDTADIFVAVNKKNGEVYIFAGKEIDKLPKKSFLKTKVEKNKENWAAISSMK